MKEITWTKEEDHDTSSHVFLTKSMRVITNGKEKNYYTDNKSELTIAVRKCGELYLSELEHPDGYITINKLQLEHVAKAIRIAIAVRDKGIT